MMALQQQWATYNPEGVLALYYDVIGTDPNFECIAVELWNDTNREQRISVKIGNRAAKTYTAAPSQHYRESSTAPNGRGLITWDVEREVWTGVLIEPA